MGLEPDAARVAAMPTIDEEEGKGDGDFKIPEPSSSPLDMPQDEPDVLISCRVPDDDIGAVGGVPENDITIDIDIGGPEAAGE